jgi:hypothetical protein
MSQKSPADRRKSVEPGQAAKSPWSSPIMMITPTSATVYVTNESGTSWQKDRNKDRSKKRD